MFDASKPIILVPFIEDDAELCALYVSNKPLFWITILDPASKVQFIIIDGAHRWVVSLELHLECVYAVAMRPEISVSEMVHTQTDTRVLTVF